MEIIYKDINELIPYKNNPRINDDAAEYVAESIKEFGFKVPVVIDKDNVIVAGHTRLKAAKSLHIKDIPCIVADDLTDEQIAAFRLADNKVGEMASWDNKLLDIELNMIQEIDMESFGFELFEDDDDLEEEEPENERLRTDDAYNLSFSDLLRTEGFYQMPIIENDEHVPCELMGFNYVLSSTEADHHKGVHFYVDDYQFERIWNNPKLYIEKLMPFDCVLTPDFSLYMDMPMSMKIWNTYRSRLIGQIMQDVGIKVIPTISWAEKETFDFCFDGIRKNAVVSISTVGVKRSPEAMQIWRDGVDAMIERLQPKTIVLYGGMVEYDFGDIEIIEFSNAVTDRMAESSKER